MQDDRRRGGGRPGGRPRSDQRGGPRRDYGDRGDFRAPRREFPRDRPSGPGERSYPPSDRPYEGDRRDSGMGRPSSPRPASPRPAPRSPMDEGGMAIRLDPRRLSLLKQLAAETNLRPGELVTTWIEERLDAERSGGTQRPASFPDGGAFAALTQRLDALARRVDELSVGTRPGTIQRKPDQRKRSNDAPMAAPKPGVEANGAADVEVMRATDVEATSATNAEAARTTTPARRGRPPKSEGQAAPAANERGPRVPLHEEIAAVIAESGPLSAGDIATAIVQRGRYSAPRSDRPLDAATVNSRVSNPIYRSRFRREDGKIGLAES